MTTPAPPLTEAQLDAEAQLDDAIGELQARLHFYMQHGPTRRVALEQVALLGREAKRALTLESELALLRQRSAFLDDVTSYLRRHLLDDITPAIGESRDASPMGLQLQSWFARLTKLEHGEPDPELAQLRREKAELTAALTEAQTKVDLLLQPPPTEEGAVWILLQHWVANHAKDKQRLRTLEAEKAEREELERRLVGWLGHESTHAIPKRKLERCPAPPGEVLVALQAHDLPREAFRTVGTGPTYEAALAAALKKVEAE